MTKPTYEQISRRLYNLRIIHDESNGFDWKTREETKSVFVRWGDEPKKKRSPEGKAFAAILKECGFDVADKGLLIRVTK